MIEIAAAVLVAKTAVAGANVIADFVCPTPEAREAFNGQFIVRVDRIKESRFEDTNKLFIPPEKYDARILGTFNMQFYAEELALKIRQKIYVAPSNALVGQIA